MIRDILLLQKRELEAKGRENLLARDADYESPLQNDLIKVIVGPRRAGKSCLGFSMLAGKGGFGYANFDDEKLIGAQNYDEIIATLDSLYGKPGFLLFDEIQNLARWELFVNRLQRQGYNMIITGSNSNLLSSELSPHLTGRHMLINVFPFSFAEFLRFDNDPSQMPEQEIKAKLSDYIACGGYPEPLAKRIDRREYLSTLFNSTIYKDIVKRFRIRLVSVIDDIASYLLSNIGKEFSYNTLGRITGSKSVHTAEKYLRYLEESFIFFRIHRFSPGLPDRPSSNKKIYCIDNGFIDARAVQRPADTGQLSENAVAVKLKKNELDGGAKVYYWKHPLQQEVDFVLKEGTEITQLIQVCLDFGDIKTREREEKSLVKAGKELKCENLLVINDGYEGAADVKWFGAAGKIRYIPLWKWLLKGAAND